MCRYLSGNTFSPRFTAPHENLAVEFVVIKHFGRESLHVEPSYGLDVVEYMLKCMFCLQIPLEIEFKRLVGCPTFDPEKNPRKS